MSKSKGAVYEREIVRLIQDEGLPAARVPLSGSMSGYPDDVVVCDTWRVECKYRRAGGCFSRLHGWLGERDALELPESGLIVYPLRFWIRLVRAHVDETETPVGIFTTKSASIQATLLHWMGDADCLALRRPRHEWLMCVRMSAVTIEGCDICDGRGCWRCDKEAS